MHKAAGINVMFRWIVLSVVLHALLLLIFSNILPLTVTNLPQGKASSFEALLQQKQGVPQVQSFDIPGEIKPNLAAPRMVMPGQKVNGPVIEKVAPVMPESAASPSIIIASTTTTGGEAQIGEARAKPVEIISQDGLREYRLGLSREARRYKRYPALARQRGLEGVVVIVVSTSAGLSVPQVSLSRSSGQELLDQQAMEMLNLAVRSASLPDSLRGRDFAIDLPIHFSLEE